MVKEHLNTSKSKTRLYRTRAEWWCVSYRREVTVTAWDWILLKTITLSKLTLGWTVYCREKALQPKRTPQIIFRSGSIITGLRLVCFLRRLHRSRKHDSVFVFPLPSLLGVGVHLSHQRGPDCWQPSLVSVACLNKHNSPVLSHYSHISSFTDLLLYISNHFRILGWSVICCKSGDNSAHSKESQILSHIAPPD